MILCGGPRCSTFTMTCIGTNPAPARWSAMPSTVIRAFDYDPDAAALVVTFVCGRRYIYYDVPVDVYDAMTRALSKGRFFNRRIRDHYDCDELTN